VLKSSTSANFNFNDFDAITLYHLKSIKITGKRWDLTCEFANSCFDDRQGAACYVRRASEP